MKEKRRVLVGTLVWLTVMMAGVIYAMDAVDFSVPFVLGKVDVRLEESRLEGGEEEGWHPVDVVLPGQYISWNPRVCNDGEDCYIRVRLMVYDDEKRERMDLACLLTEGLNTDWTEGSDGYWYYSKVLERGKSAELFRGITVPKDLPQEKWEGGAMICRIQVEAIQSQNVEQDLEAAMPWGAVTILEYQKENGTEIVYVEPMEKALQITYLGNTKKWLSNGTELFSEVACFMPGGIYCDELTIVNEDSKDLLLYMASRILEGPPWMEEIRLTIRAKVDGQEITVYDGDMTMSKITEKLLLQRIPALETGQLVFEICVPKHLDNSYVREQPQIAWTFYGELDGEQDKKDPEKDPEQEGRVPQSGSAADTGDTSVLGWLLGSMSMSLAVLGYGVCARQKGRKQDE